MLSDKIRRLIADRDKYVTTYGSYCMLRLEIDDERECLITDWVAWRSELKYVDDVRLHDTDPDLVVVVGWYHDHTSNLIRPHVNEHSLAAMSESGRKWAAEMVDAFTELKFAHIKPAN